jgi:hypothetical protein
VTRWRIGGQAADERRSAADRGEHCQAAGTARRWFNEAYNAYEPCHPYLLSRQNRFCSNAPSARLTIFSVLRAAKKPTIQV